MIMMLLKTFGLLFFLFCIPTLLSRAQVEDIITGIEGPSGMEVIDFHGMKINEHSIAAGEPRNIAHLNTGSYFVRLMAKC